MQNSLTIKKEQKYVCFYTTMDMSTIISKQTCTNLIRKKKCKETYVAEQYTLFIWKK